MGISGVLHLFLTSLHERRLNKVHVPLLAEDMAHLSINEKIVNKSRSLKKNPTGKWWPLLAKVLLPKAINVEKQRLVKRPSCC